MLGSIADQGGGLIAGTLVHTQEGLVPIEQIKVSDLVLSQPETQGELAYKRVTNTLRFEDKPVYSVSFYVSASEELDGVVTAGNHQFWRKDYGWTFANRLYCGAPVELVKSRDAQVSAVRAVFATVTEGVGWVPSIFGGDDNQNFEYGSNIDFRHGDPRINYWDKAALRVPRCIPEDLWRLGRDESRLRVTAYNLEVEDFHTYYVGQLGVWVHDVDYRTLQRILSLQRSASRNGSSATNFNLPAGPTRTAERSRTRSHADRGNDRNEAARGIDEEARTHNKKRDCGPCS